MQKNILNFIIAISIFGIVIGIARDTFFKSKETTQTTENQQPPTLIPSPSVSGIPNVKCSNAFFNFKKNTSWRYSVNTSGQIKYFTSDVLEASPSSVLIQTTFDNQKPTQTTIACKADGLYGLPLPIFSLMNIDQSSLGQYSSFLKFDNNIRFLPLDSQLKADATWSTPIPIKLNLPFNIPIDIAIQNKVTDEKKQSILVQGIKDTLTIDSTLDLSSLGQLSQLGQLNTSPTGTQKSTMKIFTYTLAEDIGITQMNIDLGDNTNKTGLTTIKLIQFTEGK